jgi:Fe-S-cluster containining protein
MTNDESTSNEPLTNDDTAGGGAGFDPSVIPPSVIDSSFVTRHSSLSDAVGHILAEVERDIAARKPVCRASGRCCKFEAYGHRLYVTAAELSHFAATLSLQNQKSKIKNQDSPIVSLPQFFSTDKPEGCPYQIDGLCTARDARPLGCRIYFCDENAQSWQNEVYEKYHAQLRELHERFHLPYRYLEWRAALRELLPAETSGEP